MSRRISQHVQQPFLILIVAVVMIGSLLMVFVRPPERITAVSADGRLAVSGLVREGVRVNVERIDTEQFQYILSVDDARILKQVTLTFPSDGSMSNGAKLIRYDLPQNTWIEDFFSYDAQQKQFIIEFDELGSTVLIVDITASDVVDNESLL